MKHISEMSTSEKYRTAYNHYLKSNRRKGYNLSLSNYKYMMPIPNVELVLYMYGLAQFH